MNEGDLSKNGKKKEQVKNEEFTEKEKKIDCHFGKRKQSKTK